LNQNFGLKEFIRYEIIILARYEVIEEITNTQTFLNKKTIDITTTSVIILLASQKNCFLKFNSFTKYTVPGFTKLFIRKVKLITLIIGITVSFLKKYLLLEPKIRAVKIE